MFEEGSKSTEDILDDTLEAHIQPEGVDPNADVWLCPICDKFDGKFERSHKAVHFHVVSDHCRGILDVQKDKEEYGKCCMLIYLCRSGCFLIFIL